MSSVLVVLWVEFLSFMINRQVYNSNEVRQAKQYFKRLDENMQCQWIYNMHTTIIGHFLTTSQIEEGTNFRDATSRRLSKVAMSLCKFLRKSLLILKKTQVISLLRICTRATIRTRYSSVMDYNIFHPQAMVNMQYVRRKTGETLNWKIFALSILVDKIYSKIR